ncbi:MAG: tpl protein [Actinobacteria bacterium]|nr:tpl protein [Actinomycetota bacterium]
MPTVVGVKFPYAGRVLWFDPAGAEPAEGDCVIVTTERGQEFGEVVTPAREVDPADLPAELKPVVRVADANDHARAESLHEREREEMERFRALVTEHGLDMKPIGAEHLFDDSKIVFYFAAEERVDFRELVRELAAELHNRIDMRQVGVRDEARMIGGLGHCGQQLCCVRFAGEFQPVSIRMAKEQDLPLNPLKISGLCGRLMCCLRYEYDAYKDFKQRAPKVGTPVDFPDGSAGRISAHNVPRELLTVRQQGGPEITVPLEALDCSAGRGCPCKLDASAVPQQAGGLGPTRGTAPALREADRSGEAQGAPRAQQPQRKRRSAKPSEGAQQSGSQGQTQRQPKSRGPKPQQAAQQGPSGQDGQAASGARRRRRRRPRTDGGSTASE